VPLGFTPDHKFLLFQDGFQPSDLHLLTLADRKVQPLLASPQFNESNGQISPNGRWLAYQSNESGSGEEIYVRPFPNVDGPKTQVSTGGGTRPLWSPTGKELFYMTQPSTIMAAPVDIAAPTLSPGNPVAVVKGDFVSTLYQGRTYTVSSDGKRFIVIKNTVSSLTPPQLLLVFNWFDELTRLVP
jgi:Tol biopolymer transport system component